ncbi:hypothetical protein T10_11092 [Trichinella papuae]|uniref:Uncharacterized protein n=1 Tax=Trichinella papuae TaxID=268474 RepID=A0A0V1N7R8_9BILA|nr:hypothetical protein T10_11092 [Trichinella papuae]
MDVQFVTILFDELSVRIEQMLHWKRPLVRIPLLVDLLICALMQKIFVREVNVLIYFGENLFAVTSIYTCNDVLCLGYSFVIVFSQIIVLLG